MVNRSDPKPHDQRTSTRACDKVTLAVFVVMLAATSGAICYLGPAQAGDRLGCGVVDLVNRSLAVHDACHALPAGQR